LASLAADFTAYGSANTFSVRGARSAPDRSGSWRLREPVIEFAVADITLETTDAIVNPAGAGLVDLAIRRVAGPSLLEAFHAGSRQLPGARLLPGHAFVTQGFALPTRHVIHCGPPAYADNPVRARHDLASCHAEALRLARELGLSSVAFPAIATGVYRYPVPEAAEIAVTTVLEELRENGGVDLVRFVLFGPATLDVYAGVARAFLG
jgi:O-acetyl-ADP-ribose deacetylase